MDALDWLEQQHRDLNGLFAAVTAADGAGHRTARVAQLVRAIEAHSRVEETVFYAAFAARVEGDERRLYEAFEDHALLRYAAGTLLRTRATDVRFPARLKLVQQLFKRHVAVEEDWMYPRAKRALHDEVLDRIGVDLERAHGARVAVGPAVPERLPLRRRPSPAPLRRAAGCTGAAMNQAVKLAAERQ